MDIASLEAFSWEDTSDSMTRHAPLLATVLNAACKRAAVQTIPSITPEIGTALSCLLHARSRIKASFIPTIFSIQLWRGGLKSETLRQVAKTGLCLGYDSTLKAVDRIREGFDSAAYKCKEALEKDVSVPVQNIGDTSDNLDTSLAIADSVANIDDEIVSSEESDTDNDNNMDVDSELDTEGEEEGETEESEEEGEEEDGDEEEEIESEGEKQIDSSMEEGFNLLEPMSPETPQNSTEEAQIHPGFTMCWDNVGKKVISRNPTEQRTNTYINMALGYIAVNRVSTTDKAWGNLHELPKAQDMPVEKFLPVYGDFDELRKRMEVIVGRIVCRHIPWFRDNFQDTVIKHIVHPYTLESTHRSVLINLGVFQENPCSTQGAIGIYETLSKYIPSIDNKPYTAIVYGDGLSCERGNDAQKARSNGLDPWERLEALEPGAQEFHKEMLLLQDYFDVFFKGASAMDRGTLCHLKNIFNFRQVKADISDNFNHAWELMCTTTEGYVCLLAKDILGMDGERPPDAPPDIETASLDQREQFMKDICEKIVQTVWHHTNVDRLKEENICGPPLFCCGEELDDPLVSCYAGNRCTRGQFFHRICAGIDDDDIPQPWYCCDECSRINTIYPYCHCKENLGNDEPMIGCSAEEDCQGSEWYHLKCLGIADEDVPEGDWFCTDKCRSKKKKRSSKDKDKSTVGNVADYVRNHSMAITWKGLNLLCRRDAVREGDGDGIISHWKLDLLHFYGSCHPKYLILAHRLIASINGWLPEKLQWDLRHNRTVNYSGGIGRNLPLDFMNEVLNRLFKELLAGARGRYTNTTIQRCSQIVGPLGEALDTIFDERIVEKEVYRHRRRNQNRDTNVQRLVRYLSNDKLFAHVNGRQHRAFPEFTLTENPRRPENFAAKMLQLSKRLDKRRRVVLQI